MFISKSFPKSIWETIPQTEQNQDITITICFLKNTDLINNDYPNEKRNLQEDDTFQINWSLKSRDMDEQQTITSSLNFYPSISEKNDYSDYDNYLFKKIFLLIVQKLIQVQGLQLDLSTQ